MNVITGAVGDVRSAGQQAGTALAKFRAVGIVSLIVAFLLLLDFAPNLAMWLAFALFLTTLLTRGPKIVEGL